MSQHLHRFLLVKQLIKKGETDKLQAPSDRPVRVVGKKKDEDTVDNFTLSTVYSFCLFTLSLLD